MSGLYERPSIAWFKAPRLAALILCFDLQPDILHATLCIRSTKKQNAGESKTSSRCSAPS